jgi:hypothetical protein
MCPLRDSASLNAFHPRSVNEYFSLERFTLALHRFVSRRFVEPRGSANRPETSGAQGTCEPL